MVKFEGKTGSKTVGVTAVQLDSQELAFDIISIRAASANTGTIYVGYNSSVTAGTSESTDGYPLFAEDEKFVFLNNLNKIYLISDTAGQKIFFDGQ